MPIHCMIGFNIKEGHAKELKDWLNSPEAVGIFKKIEKDCGFKYIDTYFTIVPTGSGHYDAYDWWELPNNAAWDKSRETNAFAELAEKTYPMTEPRPMDFLLMRTSRDVRIIYEPPVEK